MSGITTHILDTSRGRPAASVPVRLELRDGDDWHLLEEAATDADGRARLVEPEETLLVGVYRLTFEVEAYFFEHGIEAFYPLVQIQFVVREDAHYHVPLLLSPFGYSTYRGS